MEEGDMEVSIWSRLHQLAAVLVSKVGNRRLSSLLVSVMRKKGNFFLPLIGDNICKDGEQRSRSQECIHGGSSSPAIQVGRRATTSPLFVSVFWPITVGQNQSLGWYALAELHRNKTGLWPAHHFYQNSKS
jgi:hypothetical protein